MLSSSKILVQNVRFKCFWFTNEINNPSPTFDIKVKVGDNCTTDWISIPCATTSTDGGVKQFPGKNPGIIRSLVAPFLYNFDI